jgi:hypothetical protein
MQVKKASTDQTVYFHLRASADGTSKTGLLYNSAGAIASYVRTRGTRTAITLATLAAPDSAHSDGGFKEVDGTNAKGLYRFDVPDAAFATGVDEVIIHIGFTDVFEESLAIELVDERPGNLKDDAITAAKIAANAIGASEFAQAAADKVWATAARALTDKAGFSISGTKQTLDALNDITAASVWAVGTRALTDKAGFSLSAAGVLAIWHQLLSGIVTADTIGKLLFDNVNAPIGSIPTNPTLQSVWTDAKAAFLDIAISSRLATTGYTAPDNATIAAIADYVDTEVAAIKAKTDNLPTTPADEATLTAMKGAGWTTETLKAIKAAIDAISAAAMADAVWDELQSGHTDAGSFGKYLDTEVSGVGGVGSGALSCTWTVKDSLGNPMDNVQVWITTDAKGVNVIAGTLLTNSYGQVTFMLDAGTYYVWREKGGYDFSNPQTWTVS